MASFDPFSASVAGLGAITGLFGARDAAKAAEEQRQAALRATSDIPLRDFFYQGPGGLFAQIDPQGGGVQQSLGNFQSPFDALLGQSSQFLTQGSALPTSLFGTAQSALGALGDPFAAGAGVGAPGQADLMRQFQMEQALQQLGRAPTAPQEFQAQRGPERILIGRNREDAQNEYFVNPNTGEYTVNIDGKMVPTSRESIEKWASRGSFNGNNAFLNRSLLADPTSDAGFQEIMQANEAGRAQYEQALADYQTQLSDFEAQQQAIRDQFAAPAPGQQPPAQAQPPAQQAPAPGTQPAGVGLAPQIEPNALNTTNQGLSLLNIPPEVLAQNRLNVLRDQAAPFEQREFNRLQDDLFKTGRIGSSGGGLQTEAFARGLGQADLDRQLAAEDQALRLRTSAMQQTASGLAGLGEGRAQRGLFDQLATSQLGRTAGASDLSARRAMDRFNLANQLFAQTQSQDPRNLQLGLAALGGAQGLAGMNMDALGMAAGIEQARSGAATNRAQLIAGAPQGGGNIMGNAMASLGGSMFAGAVPGVFGGSGGSPAAVPAQQGAYVAPTLGGSPGFNSPGLFSFNPYAGQPTGGSAMMNTLNTMFPANMFGVS
jgi:hypothetical protein